jgi:hypothetical protein
MVQLTAAMTRSRSFLTCLLAKDEKRQHIDMISIKQTADWNAEQAALSYGFHF